MENCDGTVDRRGVRWNYGVKKEYNWNENITIKLFSFAI